MVGPIWDRNHTVARVSVFQSLPVFLEAGLQRGIAAAYEIVGVAGRWQLSKNFEIAEF